MPTEDNIIQEITAEKNDDFSLSETYQIRSWGSDYSFALLVDMYKKGMIVKPEIQRNYVWDKKEASSFIDSILLGLPLPSIFLAKTQEELMLIVDGYQRIMTVKYFVDGIFEPDKKSFNLINSEKISKQWRGKTFTELSDAEQRRILNTTIHSIIFVQDFPKEEATQENKRLYNGSLYQIFERINTSGRTLLPQEIRNCIYQGPLNKLLIELNNYHIWRKLYGLNTVDSRMRDVEFILRFFALSALFWSNYNISTNSISLKKYLNDYMDNEEVNTDSALQKLKELFIKTTNFIYKHIGEEAFHNISKMHKDKIIPKFNPTIFDSIMISSANFLEKQTVISSENYKSQRRELLKNEEYQNAISIRTTNIDSIKTRINLAFNYLYKQQ